MSADDPRRDRLRLWLRMLKTTRRIEQRLRENLRVDFDTTLPRFDVMAALARHPEGLKMSDLSGVLRVSNGNVTGIVDRLVAEGQMQRVPVPGDRRATLVRLTADGQQEFARQAQAHAGWIDDLLAGFDGPALRDLITRLDALEKEPTP
jgi:DNA-binding MarR family transcriptional regulator